MANIKHCGRARKTQTFWLKSDKEGVCNEILLSAHCLSCSQLVLEYIEVQNNHTYGAQYRIKVKEHDAWIARTDIKNADLKDGLDLQVDTSQWLKNEKRFEVHWVKGSMPFWPYTFKQSRVE